MTSQPRQRSQAPEWRQVTLIYGEKTLQKTLKIPGTATVSDVKKRGMIELQNHLRTKFPELSAITFDPDCTDIYPAASENTALKNLTGQITIILWPAAVNNSTPSPIVDAFRAANAECRVAETRVRELQAKRVADELIAEDRNLQSSSQHDNSSPHITSGGSTDSNALKAILARLTALETSNAKLETSNSKLETSNAKLETSNAKLEESVTELKMSNEKLRADSKLTMSATLGDRVAINHIRNRVLLDLGRTQLASICRYANWQDMKSKVLDRESMFDLARSCLAKDSNIDQNWRALANKPSALRMLLSRNQMRRRGNVAAHSEHRELIAESVLALQVEGERRDMIAIFQAVYRIEPT